MTDSLARILICILLNLLLPGISNGHSPHHVITDVAASTSHGSNADVFILITDQIFRSDEGGYSWKNLANGLNNRYTFTSLEISPNYDIDRTLFAASAGDGIYRSTNSGNSWRKVNAGLDERHLTKISISRNFEHDRRLLAAAKSGGVWRSENAGDSWQRVLTENVQAVGFDESVDSNGLPIIIAGDSGGRIWSSQDNGQLWELVYELPDFAAITSVAASADQVYVGTRNNGLFYSADSGRSFNYVKQFRPLRRRDCQGIDIESPTFDTFVTSVTISAHNPGAERVLVTTWYGGVYVSDDQGDSWSIWREGLRCDRQADDMAVPHYRSLRVVPGENGDSVYWLGAFNGLFRSTGDDSNWQALETLPLGLIKGMAVTNGDDENPAIAIGTYGGGFYLTADRGSEWTIGNRGLLTTRLTDISFSPDYLNNGVIHAGVSRRIMASADRGGSWQKIELINIGLGRRVVNKLDSWGLPMAWFRPAGSAVTSRVYPTHMVALPGADSERILFATRKHGLMTLDASTEVIKSVWSGTSELMNSLDISPDFVRDQTLFSSIRGQGLLRSEDGGSNWTPVNNGLAFVDQWTANPDGGDFRRDIVVAISPEYASDKSLFAGSPAADGLYTSRDRGESWARIRAGRSDVLAPVLAVAMSPDYENDNMIIVSIKGQGLLRSIDRGLRWEPVASQLRSANASIELLAFSPEFHADKTVVAASDEQLFLSADGGETWAEVPRPVRYEDMRDVVQFDGSWERQQGAQFSAMTETVMSDEGSSARLRFVGGGIRWIGSRGPGYGNADVYIDDQFIETVECGSSEVEHGRALFVVRGLDFGAHKIEVRMVSNPTSGSSKIIGVDGFDVLPATRKAN